MNAHKTKTRFRINTSMTTVKRLTYEQEKELREIERDRNIARDLVYF